MKSLIIILCMYGCINLSNRDTMNQEIKARKIVVKKENATVIQTNKNDTLVLQFNEHPARGYSWIFESEKQLKNIVFMKSNRILKSDVDDAAEIVEFYFLMSKTGEEKLVFKYFRPWESNKTAVDSCFVSVKIR